MKDLVGRTLSHYRITAPIGAGGMGEVYRATDTALRRDVAIKVLPEAVARDPERLERFRREAHLLASLNHPNIAAIYGLEEADGTPFLALELVEGEDLSAHIARGPMPLADALPIARQIADALEAAHEQGIIHRDLKPANIKVRADGTVKVLDFGLAKAMDPAGASSVDVMNSPTLTVRATQMGVVLGTAGYMAPEQARGKAVDKRADIWAFGAVFYEMLSGQRAFEGDDVSVTLASVLKEDVKWDALPQDLPATLRMLLRRCLEKDPKKRLRDIGDARIELDGGTESGDQAAVASAVQSRASRLWILAAAILVVGAFAAGWSLRPPAEPPVAYLDVDFGGDLTLREPFVISPDGQRVAFVGVDRNGKSYLSTRRFDESSVTRLREVHSDIQTMTFSPDSQWIGYVTYDRQVMKVGVAGGPPTRIASGVGSDFGHAEWGLDEILVPTYAGLSRVSIADGKSSTVTGRFGSFLPDGRTMLLGTAGLSDAGTLTSLAPGDTAPRPVARFRGRSPRYLPIGYLIYIGDNDILQAVRFDVNKKEISGEPVPLMERVQSFVSSGTGTVVFVRKDDGDDRRMLAWMDEAGRTEAILKEPGLYSSPRLSPDGKQVAFGSIDRDAILVSIHDIARGITRRLARIARPDGSAPASPYLLWTPDGRHLLYRSAGAIWLMRADGSGAPRRLLETAGTPESISPDGRRLAISLGGKDTKRDIWIATLEGGPAALQANSPVLLLGGAADELNPVFSPDGKWLAYTSDESGEALIYVLDTAHPESRWPVSSIGSFLPQWAPSGQELFFVGLTRNGPAPGLPLWVASYAVAGGAFMPGTVKNFTETSGRLVPLGASPVYGVAATGRRIVGLFDTRGTDAIRSKRTHGVIQNVFDVIQDKANVRAGK